MDPRVGEIERKPKLAELEIEEVKFFCEFNPLSNTIGKNLPVDFKEKLIRLLKKYHECFTWTIIDMLGINPNMGYQKFAIDLKAKLV